MDGTPGIERGGRWNPPGSFPVVYLNKTIELARLYVAQKLSGHPYGPEDIDPETGDVLAVVDLPSQDYVDVVTDDGCRGVGLPISYPLDASGSLMGHESCQPIGLEAWQKREAGIACRSAALGAGSQDEELAWFQRGRTLSPDRVLSFSDWFFSDVV
jgi:hypothetical protein